MEILNNGATFGEQRQKINDNFTELDEDKLDAETGKSLVDNDEIIRLSTVVNQDISNKQDKLFSGTNIKTINGESILGSGNIVVSGGGGSGDLSAYVKKDQILNIYPDLVTSIHPTGYRSGTGNEDVFTPSSTIRSTNLINLPEGNKIVIQGITAPTKALGVIIKYFKADGTYAAQANSSALIPDGAAYVVNLISFNVARFSINVSIEDKDTISVKVGTSLADVEGQTDSIKPELIPNYANITTKKDEESLKAFNRGKANKPAPITAKYGIIACGQSNIDGLVPMAEAPTWLNQSDPKLTGVNMWNRSSKAFATFKLGVNTGSNSIPNPKWSFDMVAYYKLQEFLAADIFVVKRSQGGTAIDPLGSAGGGFWNAFFERIPSGNNILLQEVENQIKLAKIAEPDLVFKCFIWHQGEGDSGKFPVTKIPADNYYHNLKNTIAYVRGVVDNPKLPFVYSSVSTLSGQYSLKVKQAMIKISQEDPFAFFIDNENAALFDGLHFGAVQSEIIGTKYFNIMKTL